MAIALLTGLTTVLHAAPPTITARVEPDSIGIGDRFDVVIDVDRDLVQVVEFPTFNPPPQSGLEVVQRVRKMTLKSKERSEKSNDEHRMIAQAIHDHDPEKAQMLANQHIMRTIENIDHCGWDNLLQESSVENQKNGK